MSKVMVFVNQSVNPKSTCEWHVVDGKVYRVRKNVFTERVLSTFTHADLHHPLWGFTFKELRNVQD